MTDLAANGTYTIEDGDTVSFQHGGEDSSGTLIINNRIVLVSYDSATDSITLTETNQEHERSMTFSVENEEQDMNPVGSLPQSDIPTYNNDRFPYHWIVTIFISAKDAESLDLNFSFTEPLPGGRADSTYLLPQDSIDTLVEYLNDRKSEPGKQWSEFTLDHKWWEFFKRLAGIGMIKWEDIPDEPKIEDYSTS